MAYRETATVISKDKIAGDVYDIWFETEKIAQEAVPGQFVLVYSKDKARLLPRPISVCLTEGNKLRLVFRAVGEGTKEFSEFETGDKVEIQGPVGHGYDLSNKKKALIFGGGIGIPPMLNLAKELDCEKQIVLGYRDELFLNEEFEKYGQVYIATEDGSCGTKGNVLNAVDELSLDADVLYACGPMPMLRAIKNYAIAHDKEAYISLEEKMACGMGACLSCVCKSKEVDGHSKVKNKRVCTEGPVFDAREVEI